MKVIGTLENGQYLLTADREEIANALGFESGRDLNRPISFGMTVDVSRLYRRLEIARKGRMDLVQDLAEVLASEVKE